MLAALLLFSCQAPPGAPAGLSELQRRIADEARPIHPAGQEFVAYLSSTGMEARFRDAGVRLSGSTDPDSGLGIRFSGWGREKIDPVPPVSGALGGCADARQATDRCIRRLEYARTSVVEWWIGLDRGVEQGWTLLQRPAGTAPLVIEVALDGVAAIHAADGGLRIIDRSGAAWEVGQLLAVDADGRTLPADMAESRAGLRITIDDRGARWPLTVDPVYETAATTLLGGTYRLGEAIAGVGDIDGDGFRDVLVSAPAVGNETGQVRLHLGSASGLTRAPAQILQGADVTSRFGAAMTALGDLDGDGHPEVAIAAPGEDDGTGAVYIHVGGPTGLEEEPRWTLRGQLPGDEFGASLATGGDLDGDGYMDLVVGAPSANDDTGEIHVFQGSAEGWAEEPAYSLTRTVDLAAFGTSLAILGDMDGDGDDELVVGAPDAVGVRGRAWYYPGSSSGPDASDVTMLDGDGSVEGFGASMANLGDTNGDGFDEVAIGAPYSNENGAVFLYSRGTDGISDLPIATLSASSHYLFGWSVAAVGDVNGDSYADLLVGSPDSATTQGAAHVHLGSPSGPGATPDLTFSGSVFSEKGLSTAGLGDLDGDGYDDLAIGSPGYDGDEGLVEYYAGGPAGPASAPTTNLFGESASTFFGRTLAGAGDLNGDGADDVAIGAWWSEQVYVFEGGPAGLALLADTILSSPDAGSSAFGRSLVGAGDMNGDGLVDLAIGAPSVDDGAGRMYLYLGSTAGLGPEPDAWLSGEEEGAGLGYSVDAAGDVDGDGFADLVVGAPLQDSRSGRVTLAYGGSEGLSERSVQHLDAPDSDGSFGQAVAGLRDVDGDGYDDVLVGAPRHDGSRGRTYLYRGSAEGLESSPTWTADGAEEGDLFGGAVARAGDVDGDGLADALVAASAAEDEAGTVYLFRGNGSGLDAEAALVLRGEAASGFGNSLAGAGDLDADGRADIVVGASDLDVSGIGGSAGGVYVYDGDSAEATITLHGTRENQGSGSAVAMAGDVNQDGYTDLLVGTDASLVRVYLGFADDDGDGILSLEDCDDTDAGVGGPTELLFADDDGDGFGDPADQALACADEGRVADSSDCDDTDAAVNPDADEIPGDGIDQDCDGLDGDGGTDGGGTDDGGADDGGADDGGADDGGADEDGKDGCRGCASAPSQGAEFAVGLVLLAALGRRRRR